jgi:hypothetical protein
MQASASAHIAVSGACIISMYMSMFMQHNWIGNKIKNEVPPEDVNIY